MYQDITKCLEKSIYVFMGIIKKETHSHTPHDTLTLHEWFSTMMPGTDTYTVMSESICDIREMHSISCKTKDSDSPFFFFCSNELHCTVLCFKYLPLGECIVNQIFFNTFNLGIPSYRFDIFDSSKETSSPDDMWSSGLKSGGQS